MHYQVTKLLALPYGIRNINITVIVKAFPSALPTITPRLDGFLIGRSREIVINGTLMF
jgi:hypothetical protein